MAKRTRTRSNEWLATLGGYLLFKGVLLLPVFPAAAALGLAMEGDWRAFIALGVTVVALLTSVALYRRIAMR